MHCYNYVFLNKCSTATTPIHISFSIGVHVEREKQTSKKQLILSTLWKPHSLKQSNLPNSMLLRKKRKKETRKERERSGRVAENPAGVYLVHNSRAVTSQGSLNYNPVHYIWMSWLVYCWCEICSCNCGNAEFTEYKESTVAAGSPGEGSQIPTQASPYQALALSSTHG